MGEARAYGSSPLYVIARTIQEELYVYNKALRF